MIKMPEQTRLIDSIEALLIINPKKKIDIIVAIIGPNPLAIG
jgi:hypothetical protein